MRTHLALLFLSVLLVTACSVVAPPPMMMHQSESTFRDAPGTVAVGAYGGMTGGPFLETAAGGLAVGSMQITDTVKVGVSGGGGHRLPTTDNTNGAPTTLGAGRIFVQAQPENVSWLKFNGGLGAGGTDSGLRYGTADVGVSGGWTFAEKIRPYAALAVALSVPVVAGAAIVWHDNSAGRLPATTVYADACAGVVIAVAQQLEWAAETYWSQGASVTGEGVAVIGWSTGLRYRFGEPAAARAPQTSAP